MSLPLDLPRGPLLGYRGLSGLQRSGGCEGHLGHIQFQPEPLLRDPSGMHRKSMAKYRVPSSIGTR